MDYKLFAKKIYRYLKNKKNDFLEKGKIKNIVAMPTYNPEKEIKSNRIMRKELIDWQRRFHEINLFYKMYGLDVVSSDDRGFIDYRSFMETRNVANRVKTIESQAVLLRDKFLFYKFMKSCGMPVPEVFAVVDCGYLYDENMVEIEWESLKNEKDFFIKEIDGECASFVKHVKNYEELLEICKLEKNRKFILQRRLEQCAKMKEMNSGAINTLRIVTINKKGKVYVLTNLLRIGTSKTGSVDNWAAGGIAIGVNSNGYLKKWGYFKPGFGTKTSVHPDSKIVFEEFKVPQYENALKTACDAHRLFYGLRAIGWDVAISEEGPMFIEGNDNWEISLQQVCDRPLKKDWLDAVQD